METKNLAIVVEHIADKNSAGAIAAIDSALIGETGVDWIEYLTRLKHFLVDGIPRFTINKETGNSKLPFVAFSALPGKRFCPGAGDCLKFCYSFRAWRYPAAFCRMVQNTVLLNTASGRAKISADLIRLSGKKKYINGLTFRLYVDGDFRHLTDLGFWFELLAANPIIQAYGYSKSFLVILEHVKKGGILPANYTLNISGGNRHQSRTIDKIRALPITRGEFLSIPMNHIKPENGRLHTRAQIQREYIATTGGKAFICPGQCGDCVKLKGDNLHFCGGDNPLPVAIAQH